MGLGRSARSARGYDKPVTTQALIRLPPPFHRKMHRPYRKWYDDSLAGVEAAGCQLSNAKISHRRLCDHVSLV